jgi:hypothetical protein
VSIFVVSLIMMTVLPSGSVVMVVFSAIVIIMGCPALFMASSSWRRSYSRLLQALFPALIMSRASRFFPIR